MKHIKKIRRFFVILLCVTLLVPVTLPNITTTKVASAAKVKLNRSKLTLVVGKTKKLKVSGSKRKVKWKSNKKSVATVNKHGKVTAKAPGKAVITASIGSKKYKCKVTVVPFTSQRHSFDSFSFHLPKDWTTSTTDTTEGAQIILHPDTKKTPEDSSGVLVQLTPTNIKAPDYTIQKATLSPIISEEAQLALYQEIFQQEGLGKEQISLHSFKQKDYTSKLGKCLKTTFVLTYEEKDFTALSCYHMYIDNYFLQVIGTDLFDGVTPDVATVAQYVMDTFTVKE